MLFLLLGLALVVGALGSTRKIGFWGAFFASFVLTPLGGLLIVAVSAPANSRSRDRSD